MLIANYGYKDGSGEYFITLDTDKCDGCGKCVEICPASVLEVIPNEFDIDDGNIMGVSEEHRHKLKYSCAPCKSTSGDVEPPCVVACPTRAITHFLSTAKGQVL
jgi:ferredoxin